jgi:hypothetical protein
MKATMFMCTAIKAHRITEVPYILAAKKMASKMAFLYIALNPRIEHP